MKSQICIHEDTDEIIDISESAACRTVDITLPGQSGVLSCLPEGISAIGDLGYMSIDTSLPFELLPTQEAAQQRMLPEDMAYNSAFSRRGIPVEQAIDGVRRYQAITQPDRHHRQLLIACTRAVAGHTDRRIRSGLLYFPGREAGTCTSFPYFEC